MYLSLRKWYVWRERDGVKEIRLTKPGDQRRPDMWDVQIDSLERIHVKFWMWWNLVYIVCEIISQNLTHLWCAISRLVKIWKDILKSRGSQPGDRGPLEGLSKLPRWLRWFTQIQDKSSIKMSKNNNKSKDIS